MYGERERERESGKSMDLSSGLARPDPAATGRKGKVR